ncbi:retrovirus-related Pol polyprotein from transposon 297 [Trichonephila clavipes]|uniref:RNA-directed DNA polymerase n=1 Tax=Trichonephila clavipes TaxID=2585209 RepID=A0A8X6S1Y0_TRICX|nr:retrovirus-related Pol polyprotein from transposon 297 [Trichonephila clavipes]
MSNFGSHCGSGFSHPFRDQSSGCSRVPYPSHETQIRAFLGLAGYYQKYINLFLVIAVPLTDALKGRAKKGEITWTTECENAFRELKGKLIDKPVLYAPNFEREFIVQTDASNAGMGAVLTQLNEQGEEHPILYLSKKFSEVEKRYCTTEKECASIIFAIKRLHYYLDGNSF